MSIILRALFKGDTLIEMDEVDSGTAVPSGFEARTIAPTLKPYIGGDWGGHPAHGIGPVTPEALEQFRAALLTRLAECRWAAQVRGVVIDGRRWHSNEGGRSALVEAVTISAVWQETYPADRWETQWKTADGFITVDRATVIAAGLAVAAHIQGVFRREAALGELIAVGDFEQLAVLASEIEGGW
jgi:hypothetical protein